ncbi:hypothetical protein CRG98_043585 [Punica granatum]|uniref:Uncharacterized protein n=1 Tax=Punica granatum TaxID=22663 RepID=A0A2I0HWW6_PUNGR|nr:hypothetical protein CRG98_043585 [Punica granatum]
MVEGSSSRAKGKAVCFITPSGSAIKFRQPSFFDAVAKGMLHHDDGLHLPSLYATSTSARDAYIQLDNYGLGYLLVDSDDDDDQAKVVFASDKGILMQEPRNRKRHPGTTQRKLTMRSWKRPASPQFLRSPASRDLENRYSVVVVHHSS